jgi:hypothetical protein
MAHSRNDSKNNGKLSETTFETNEELSKSRASNLRSNEECNSKNEARNEPSNQGTYSKRVAVGAASTDTVDDLPTPGVVQILLVDDNVQDAHVALAEPTWSPQQRNCMYCFLGWGMLSVLAALTPGLVVGMRNQSDEPIVQPTFPPYVDEDSDHDSADAVAAPTSALSENWNGPDLPNSDTPDLPTTDILKLHRLQLVKDHNSYELAGPNEIGKRLEVTPVIELDVWADGEGDWKVSHVIPLPSDPLLSEYFQAIKDWRDDNPNHDLMWINIDFKTDWLAGSGKGDFESLIRDYFDERVLFRPKDLKGSYSDARTAAGNGAWPTASSLKDRVIFVITGGPPLRHNQHMSIYVKEEIMDNNYEGAAFVAPDTDDYDDVNYPSGDLDGTNTEKMHVVMFNGKWENRAKINTASVYNQNLLMWFWNVPTDKTNFASAVDIYQGSIIGSTSEPEDIQVITGKTLTGQRGRDMGVFLEMCYEDDNGWQGHGDTFNLGVGVYDNKGSYDSSGNPLTGLE